MAWTFLLLIPLSPWLNDSPYWGDVYRFPNVEACRAAMAANVAFRNEVTARLDWEVRNYWALQDALNEAYESYQVWDWALTVAGGYVGTQPNWTPQMGLKGLRQRLSPEDYYSGTMPPAVPIDRFPWR